MTNALRMVDLSSNNGPADLAKHYKAGYRTLALKATEGLTYTWAEAGALADEWHKLGGHVWHYCYAQPAGRNNVLAAQSQARYFLAAIAAHWKAGDRLVIDAEVAGIDAAFVAAFIGFCHDTHPDRAGLVYSYASFLEGAKIRPSHSWGLWLADYTAKKPPKPVAGWTRLDAWQHTDKATGVPGIPGAVDQSFLYPEVPPVKATPLAGTTRIALRLVARNLTGRNQPVAAVDQPVLTAALTQIQRVQGLK